MPVTGTQTYDESQFYFWWGGGVVVGETNDAHPDTVVDVANFCFDDHKIKIIEFRQLPMTDTVRIS